MQERNVGEQTLDFGGDFAPRRESDVFVGEIDLDFQMGANRDDLRAHFGDARGQCAGELRQRVGEGGIAARGDDVGDGFGLGQVDAAVEKCAAGEFAGRGEARAGGDCDRDDAADDELAAVALDFGDVLASKAGRLTHHECERAIDAGAGGGIDDVTETHHAGCELAGVRGVEDGVENCECARAGEADDGDGAEAGCGGWGYDRVGGVHRKKELDCM